MQGKKLETILEAVTIKNIIGDIERDILGLAYDSRRVKKDDLFFCINGLKADGHEFAHKAQEAGATAVVVERVLPDITVTQIVVDNTREAMAKMASAFFDYPTRNLKLIGITGTNGKTTTSYMVESVLSAAGYKTGMLGTVEYRIGSERIPVDRTTPESLDLQEFFARMVDAGVDAAVIEVSSHAIDLLRVEACEFDVVVFTNLSQDHLDYHGTIEEYFKVKKRIFDMTGVNQVINIDDEYGRKLLRTGERKQLRYSLKDKVEVYASGIVLRADGSTMKLHAGSRIIGVDLKMPGLYNISNALAAASASIAVGIDVEKIKVGLEELEFVPGRFERVDAGQAFTVIVDYAHTPDSLEKVLTAARQLTEGRLITLFGCGGDRDKGKRPMMGRIAAELSDTVIITSDNPRSEDAMQVIMEINNGIEESLLSRCVIEENRRNAIVMALEGAQEGDFVVIAGKGHEQGQEIAGGKLPFDDREIAVELLREMVKWSR
ncbi:MAG: UDP-N-acetylmuramoyl-L-alanyl-D-glutamate--2,6-diaminopimelate ligase [Candidatus Aquicultor sp.]